MGSSQSEENEKSFEKSNHAARCTHGEQVQGTFRWNAIAGLVLGTSHRLLLPGQCSPAVEVSCRVEILALDSLDFETLNKMGHKEARHLFLEGRSINDPFTFQVVGGVLGEPLTISGEEITDETTKVVVSIGYRRSGTFEPSSHKTPNLTI